MRLTSIGVLLATTALAAQDGPLLYIGPTTDADVRWAQAADFDGSLLFCRGFYTSTRYEANGSGWWTDYPGADQNLLARMADLTMVRVRLGRNRVPFYVVVGLSDPLLMKCPVLFMSDVGTIGLTDRDVLALKAFFAKGGFLWVDDFWGTAAWEQWELEIRRVLPAGEYRLFEIPTEHPIFHQLYDVQGIWQMPTIGLWGTCGGALESHDGDGCIGGTSERGRDSETPHFRGVEDARGRLIVVMSFNTDIADGWEEEKEDNRAYVQEFSARSYALGTNIFLYAMTH